MKKIFTLLASLIILSSCASSVQETGSVNKDFSLADFKGKPSVVLFAGTYCSHCQAAIPEYEEKIWNNFKDIANLWINVIDQKKFETMAAQGFNSSLSFEGLSGKSCMYVPAFIVLDKNTFPTMTSCGSEKTIDDMKAEVERLLSDN